MQAKSINRSACEAFADTGENHLFVVVTVRLRGIHAKPFMIGVQ